MDRIEHLRREIAQREVELADLKAQLAEAETESQQQQQQQQQQRQAEDSSSWKWPLKAHEYQRYSRQMIVPDFGLQGQLCLNRAKVLLVGAGGLGCPAAAYLAGAGVGTLGLVDGDEVEVSNLHRQVAHSTARVGMSKVESAITYLKSLNPTITYNSHCTHLTPQNAVDIVSRYDLVLDCTDHPASRYLVSDSCVLLGKPLISASAFQTSGQLTTLNSPPGKGPYRCLFPRPPPPESVVGCGEGGILGPVVGTMGVLQALEAVKLVVRGGVDGGDAPEKTSMMLLFTGMADAPFRSVRMRGRRKDCFACGDESSLSRETLESSMDYVQFCGVRQPVQLLQPNERITAEAYSQMAQQPAQAASHLLLDVREKEHFDLCHLPGSVNVPIGKFMRARSDEIPEEMPSDLAPSTPIYVVCRVGNDSQIAAQKLKDLGLGRDGQRFIGDIKGGMKAWNDTVDRSLPFI